MVLVSEQAITFLLTVFAGCIIGLVYDIIRIVRRVIPHRHWAINVEDFLFFIFCGVWFFYILFSDNYGEIRLFSFIGLLLGVVIYFCSLSPIIVRGGTFVMEKLLQVIWAILTVIIYPIRLLLRIILFPFRKVGRFVSKHSKRKLTKSRKWFMMKWKGALRSIRVIIRKI